ncbi:MAG: hypothetical protein PHD43_23345 [Methylococcales bacterium]|nr:hypothetical protein [Methylococcales bacterium]
MKQINKEKVWKYFWEQKIEELSNIALILFIILSLAGLLVQIGWQCKEHGIGEMKDCGGLFTGSKCPATACNVPYEPSLPYWMLYTGIITTSWWILYGIWCLIKSNWEEAKKRVKQEMCKHSFDRYGCCKLCSIDKDDI